MKLNLNPDITMEELEEEDFSKDTDDLEESARDMDEKIPFHTDEDCFNEDEDDEELDKLPWE